MMATATYRVRWANGLGPIRDPVLAAQGLINASAMGVRYRRLDRGYGA
jgi:hypothetical protein